MDAHIDVEVVVLGSCLKASDKGRFGLGLGEGKRLLG